MPAKPKLEKFEVMRANSDGTLNDEGTALVFNIKTSFEDDTHYMDFGLTIEFIEYDPYGSGTPATTNMSVLPNDELLTYMKSSGGLNGSPLHGTTFTVVTTKTYNVKARLTDGQEYAYAFSTIPFAFANVHLGGSSQGGVAFGKYLQNVGSFECNFNSRFYGNVIVDGASYFSNTAVFDLNTVNGVRRKVWFRTGTEQNPNNRVVVDADGLTSFGKLEGYNLNIGAGGATIAGNLSAGAITGTSFTGDIVNIKTTSVAEPGLASETEGIYDLNFGSNVILATVSLRSEDNLSKTPYQIDYISGQFVRVHVYNNGAAAKSFWIDGIAKCS